MRKEIEQDQSVLGVALTGFPSCPPSERGKSRVLIRRPRKITEKYSLGLLPTAGGEVAQGRDPIKKVVTGGDGEAAAAAGGDSSGSRGKEEAPPIDLPGPARPGVKSGKEEPREFLRTGAHARNPARTGSHGPEGFGFFQLSPGNSRAGAGAGEGQRRTG